MDSAQPLVIGLGEVLWDIFPDGKRLGGAPANFAYHASRQGCEGVLVSAIGNDALGAEIESLLREKSLAFCLEKLPLPTGSVTVFVDSDGIASYVFEKNCAWDALPFTPAMESLARRADAVCFGSLAQRDRRSREAIHRFLDCVPETALKIFDINLRQNFYSREIIEASLARASILKLNDDETPILAEMYEIDSRSRDELIAELFKRYPSLNLIIQTLGKNGSVVVCRDGERSVREADSSVCVVDTVGAGDAFTAGFVSASLAGKTLSAAHAHAAALADFVCSCPGAMPDYQ